MPALSCMSGFQLFNSGLRPSGEPALYCREGCSIEVWTSFPNFLHCEVQRRAASLTGLACLQGRAVGLLCCCSRRVQWVWPGQGSFMAGVSGRATSGGSAWALPGLGVQVAR
jgi:hypothetical protein